MPAYNFKEQFVDDIIDEVKGGTIRNYRRYPQRVGDMMHLYTGLRTKHARKLKSVPCIEVYDITILKDRVKLKTGPKMDHTKSVPWAMTIKDRDLLNDFAIGDGFSSWEEMKRWWRITHELPWNGFHARWTPLHSVFKTA